MVSNRDGQLRQVHRFCVLLAVRCVQLHLLTGGVGRHFAGRRGRPAVRAGHGGDRQQHIAGQRLRPDGCADFGYRRGGRRFGPLHGIFLQPRSKPSGPGLHLTVQTGSHGGEEAQNQQFGSKCGDRDAPGPERADQRADRSGFIAHFQQVDPE